MRPAFHPFEQLNYYSKSKPSKLFIYTEEETYTYEDSLNIVLKLAQWLKEKGIKAEDRVGIALTKKPETVFLYLAAFYLDAIPFPIHPEETSSYIDTIINKINPGIIIGNGRNDIDNFMEFNKDTFDTAIKENVSLDRNKEWSDPEQVAYLNFTSGSTGEPKAAITTYDNIFHNTISSIEALKLNVFDVHLCLFPIWVHPHEIWARPLYLGGSLALTDTVFPKTMHNIIEKANITAMMAVAPIYQTLISIKTPLRISSLRVAESGGMYFPPFLIKEFRNKTGITVIPVWGSTETTGIAFYNDDPKGDVTSIGKLCPGYEYRLSEGVVKELMIRGKGVVSGYYNLDEENRKNFRDGWYYTGDNIIEKDGNLIFIGREAGLIKVAGLKAYPLEIEQALLKHPAVSEAAVIATEDKIKGEVPKAFISLKSESETPLEIRKFLREHLLDYKIPKDIEILEGLPKTSSGKVSYKRLKEMELEQTKILLELERKINKLDIELISIIKQRYDLLMEILNMRKSLELSSYSLRLKKELSDKAAEEALKQDLPIDVIRDLLDILFDKSSLRNI
ncbi:MAG: AMP-binding protein [Candidatus Coatesbacteria bacterium]|nr:AMP-binding protein [Candidatus Coatesbacteria bacterium]